MTHYYQARHTQHAKFRHQKSAHQSENVLLKIGILLAMSYLIFIENLSVSMSFGSFSVGERITPGVAAAGIFAATATDQKTKPATTVQIPAGSINNTTFAVDDGFAARNKIPPLTVQQRTTKCRDYIDRFAPIAVAEMQKYGIPASVILAQGLLESNAGESALAQKANNHFGIKCFSQRCKRGHCLNFTDDTHKDFFVKYGNIWGCYRAHSQFLKSTSRYAKLFKLSASDYHGWANGLAKAGYATDKQYAQKLIALIESLGLDQFDRA